MPTRSPPPADDTPLDETGELLLAPELQQLADALRGEAARLAEQVVPQNAAAELFRRLEERETSLSVLSEERCRDTRARWILAVVGSLITLVTLAGGGIAWRLASPNLSATTEVSQELHPGRGTNSNVSNSPTHRQPSRNIPAGTQSAGEDRFASGPVPPNLSVSARDFLSVTPLESPLWMGERDPRIDRDSAESGDAWLADPQRLESDLLLTTAGKMRILERALERYWSVIEFQQERILQNQLELQAAREEIERLRGELESARSPTR